MKIRLFLLILFVVVGCENELLLNDNDKTPQIEFVLNTRLDIDENGLFHLKVNRNTFQTLHRLSGNIYEDGEPMDVVKFGWTSSHYFQLGDTLGYFIHRGLTDDLVYVSYDTTYITGFSDFIVPTINCCSYSNSDGEVNSMIGVIKKMVDDTLTISVSYYHPYTSELEGETFRIVLE
jgi:hypothetical protein|tara:strand:- start:347 stop:877 length:531 start_codon:yes stop_codon:yes gene_type:complete